MIRYTRIKPYHYRLLEDEVFALPAESIVGGVVQRIQWPSVRFEDGLLNLVDLRQKGARLTVAGDSSRGRGRGYSWDGSTGVPDTQTSMRASLAHDPLCQLCRAGLVPIAFRPVIDRVYFDICVEDGMVLWRAKVRLVGLKLFSKNAMKTVLGP